MSIAIVSDSKPMFCGCVVREFDRRLKKAAMKIGELY